jgi:diaminopropionate ammonia-lyase
MTDWLVNPAAGPLPAPSFRSEAALAFHRKLPGYAPTPLVDATSLAQRLGLRRVVVKNESARFGLPSFKLLGASWATYRALVDRLGSEPAWSTFEELARAVSHLAPFTLAAATDGNHGRAVAHMARRLGFACRVFVPRGTSGARIAAIESEGAHVSVVDGNYDETIRRSAEEESERCLVIDDTAWPGYEDVPRWVIEGYGTIFVEVDEQLGHPPDVAFMPLGVGALGAAATDHYKAPPRARVVGVEPERAACVLASIRAGEPVTVPEPQNSIMAGLNCGTPSPIAFPTLAAGMDGVVAIEDRFARQAMRDLAAEGVVAGETGAAALAGLEALAQKPEHASARASMGLDAHATVLVLCTEGATDPESYARIVGHQPDAPVRL